MGTYNMNWSFLRLDLVRSALVLIILFLGILNPVKGNSLDKFFGYFLFVFVAFYIFLPKKLVKFRKYAVWVVILCFLVSSLATSVQLRAMLSRDLPLYTYNNDEGAFLKTYKLMKSNVYYYDAFKIAFLGKFTGPAVPGDVWAWRLPTIFEIWKFVPGGGIGIFILYLVLACGVLYTAFRIGYRYLGEHLAILPAYFVFPYLHFGARDEILLLTEWWAVPFFLFGLFLFIKRRYFMAILALSLAVLIREVYIVPLALFFGYFALKFKKDAFIFLIPLAAFFLFFAYHVTALSSYIDSWHLIFSTRGISAGTFFVNQTLAFGSWEYAFYKVRLFLVFLFLAILACFYIFRNVSKDEGIVWFIAVLAFPLLFLKLGIGPYHDYWGIIYMPFVLVLAPVALGNLIKKVN